jgi:hypothetical protein
VQPLGVLYEHPRWFEPLFAELERRGAPYERLDARSLVVDPAAPAGAFGLVLNRMSPSAWTRGAAEAIVHTRHCLAAWEEAGVPVVNGSRAFEVELSKARQLALLAALGLPHPRSRAIASAAAAPAAAEALRFPVVVKPNVGGSGAGIRAFATPEALREAVEAGALELGLDGTGLVQEQLPAEGESVVRLELLDGRLLYAIRIRLVPGTFNLCPADYCELPGIADGVSGRGLPIERFEPPAEVVDAALRLVAAAGMDVAGVEYLVDSRDGTPTFYDVNALSNFVADAPAVLGFDPVVDLVDSLLARVAALARAA